MLKTSEHGSQQEQVEIFGSEDLWALVESSIKHDGNYTGYELPDLEGLIAQWYDSLPKTSDNFKAVAGYHNDNDATWNEAYQIASGKRMRLLELGAAPRSYRKVEMREH